MGVNLQKLDATGILVDKANKKIVINLPPAEVFNSNIVGDIELENSEGILKKIFASDTNKDFNLAFSKLNSEAINAVKNNTEVMVEAREETIKLLKLILKDTDFEIVIEKD